MSEASEHAAMLKAREELRAKASAMNDEETYEMLLEGCKKPGTPENSQSAPEADIESDKVDKDEQSCVQEVQENAFTTPPEEAAVAACKISSSLKAGDYIISPENRSETFSASDLTRKLKRPNSAHLDKKSIENNNHARLDERLIVSNKILVHLETKLSLYHNTMRRVPFLSRALSDSEKSSNNDETDQDAPTIDQKALEAADLADNRGMLSILAEISLKALFSPVNNLATDPSEPYPTDLSMVRIAPGVSLSQFMWDGAGHLKINNFPDVVERARCVHVVIGNIILCQYYVANQRMPPISALRDYLAFLATILPQLHYLAETAIGNSLAAQAAGATAAWNLLFTAVAKLVVPFFADFDHVDKFNDIDRQNLAKIDEILAIIFQRKFEATMAEFHGRGVNRRYTEMHMRWVKDMEQELNLITSRLSLLNGGTAFMGDSGAVGGFLSKTIAVWRDAMAEYGRLTMIYGIDGRM